MRNAWRSTAAWDWAKKNANLLHDILPEHVCEAAAATCRITLQGPESVGDKAKNWGQWIRMRMQTFGHTPFHLSAAVQQDHHWISTDSREAVNVVLDCFGLTLDDVFAHYGEPEEGEIRTIDLYDVVTDLYDIVTEPAANVA